MGNVHVMSFSPTGGSRKAAMEVGKQIALSAGCAVGELSLNRPDDRAAQYHFGPEDLLVLAYPVYGGWMPALLEETMTHLAGENTPAVVLAVYGNRAYEDALLEGVERLEKQGFVPIAAGAFVAAPWPEAVPMKATWLWPGSWEKRRQRNGRKGTKPW